MQPSSALGQKAGGDDCRCRRAEAIPAVLRPFAGTFAELRAMAYRNLLGNSVCAYF
jgi:hypothetical protein